jgi:hypothetical protein
VFQSLSTAATVPKRRNAQGDQATDFGPGVGPFGKPNSQRERIPVVLLRLLFLEEFFKWRTGDGQMAVF